MKNHYPPIHSTPNPSDNITSLLGSISDTLNQSRYDITKLCAYLAASSSRVFVVGAGRSGIVLCAFANRLMHLGFTVVVVGETTSPPITTGDTLLVVSASGRTAFPLTCARKARDVGATVIAVLSDKSSPLAEVSHLVVSLDLASHEYPLGTLFETSAFLALEGILLSLAQTRGVCEIDMARRHTNLE